MSKGIFFTYEDNEKLKQQFIYNRVILISTEAKKQEKCQFLYKKNIFPQYPISIELKENKIIFKISEPVFTKNEENIIYFSNKTIVLPLDDEFLSSTRINNLFHETISFNDDYLIKDPIFFSKFFVENDKKRNNFQIGRVFLDFLYDFFYSNVFKNSQYYEKTKRAILGIPVIKYIFSKYQFLYSKEIRDSSLYLEILDNWFSLLEDPKSEKILNSANNWFDDLPMEVERVSEEIFKQKIDKKKLNLPERVIKKKKLDILQERVINWQISNFQIIEVVKKQKSRKKSKKSKINFFSTTLAILAFLTAIGIFFVPNIYSIILFIFSFLLSLCFVLFLWIKLGFNNLLKILSFEIFLVSVITWTAISFSPFLTSLPYSINTFFLAFLFTILIVFLFFIIKARIKYLTVINTFVIILINLLVSFYTGVIVINFNKKNILTEENQKEILQEKNLLHIATNNTKILNNNIYFFPSKNDTLSINNRLVILRDTTNNGTIVIKKNKSNLFLQKDTYYLKKQDSLLISISKDSLLFKQSQLCNMKTLVSSYVFGENVIFMRLYILFWTVISSFLGIFSYIWVNSKVKGKL